MSTLAGGTPALDRRATGGGNPIGRAGAWIGGRLIAVLGAFSDRVAEAWGCRRPPRADRPAAAGSRAVLWIGCVLILAFLALPAFFMVPVSFTSEAFIDWPP